MCVCVRACVYRYIKSSTVKYLFVYKSEDIGQSAVPSLETAISIKMESATTREGYLRIEKATIQEHNF